MHQSITVYNIYSTLTRAGLRMHDLRQALGPSAHAWGDAGYTLYEEAME